MTITFAPGSAVETVELAPVDIGTLIEKILQLAREPKTFDDIILFANALVAAVNKVK